ncbi:hypothetical protein AVEN_141737-1 [Araneus ventricosus]|uniref:Endonuclease/exonuclease/phosphatase domain-containing protein n=1 Tax=Araneus ventricosus TaxID=182803 RepID=A0A4Y2IC06_ARAVE|nr:hypothetical protein AVEN_141737-1 [Araneus ventricosus]
MFNSANPKNKIKNLQSLTIVFWNANGERNRSADIRNFLEEHSPDIFLIQETKLRPEINFPIPNYDVYRTDRPQRNNAPIKGGGTGILIFKNPYPTTIFRRRNCTLLKLPPSH